MLVNHAGLETSVFLLSESVRDMRKRERELNDNRLASVKIVYVF